MENYVIPKGFKTYPEITARAAHIYELLKDVIVKVKLIYPNVTFTVTGQLPNVEVYIDGTKTSGTDYELTMWKKVPVFDMRVDSFMAFHPTNPSEHYLLARSCFAGSKGSEDWRLDDESQQGLMKESILFAIKDFTVQILEKL